MEAPASFHLILLHLHNSQSITRCFQHHHPHKYHYWICDPQRSVYHRSRTFFLIELEVSRPCQLEKKNKKKKKRYSNPSKATGFIPILIVYLSSPLLLPKRPNRYSSGVDVENRGGGEEEEEEDEEKRTRYLPYIDNDDEEEEDEEIECTFFS